MSRLTSNGPACGLLVTFRGGLGWSLTCQGYISDTPSKGVSHILSLNTVLVTPYPVTSGPNPLCAATAIGHGIRGLNPRIIDLEFADILPTNFR